MRRQILIALPACFCLISGFVAGAVTLPLQGYYKPAHYFPVQFDGGDAANPARCTAEGCMPTATDAANDSSIVVPVLVTGNPRELAVGSQKFPLHRPADNERLVAGLTIEQIQNASAVFPGNKLLPITLDPAALISGPPVAWESLDAIVLDTAAFQRLDDSQRSVLLAGGVTLIATGNQPPDSRWPWYRIGNLWTLSHANAGPQGDLIDPGVYAATSNWNPGWSLTIRKQIVGIAALLVLVTIALSLSQHRAGYIASITVCLTATIAIIAWRHTLGSVDRAGGNILVADNGLIQTDQFVYERAKENATSTIPWTGSTHPLFSSPASMNQSAMQLQRSATGELAFVYHAQQHHAMAFLRRQVLPGPVPVALASQSSPMQTVAKTDYIDQNHRMAGQTAGAGGGWDSVIIIPRPPTSLPP